MQGSNRNPLCGPSGPHPSLELATKLARPLGAAWVLGLYPDAAEATATFRYTVRRNRSCWQPGPAPWEPEWELENPIEEQEAAARRSIAEAARRARSKLRRYAVANRLDRLGTLTFASDGCHDERELRRHVRHFVKRLRPALGDGRFPYVWVPEWHKTHGLHAHLLVGRFIKHQLLEDVWGHGFVHIKRIGPRRGSGLAASRTSARYLSKYLDKTFDHPRTPGLHRYELGQGFMPRVERIEGTSRASVLEEASRRMGGRPSYLWDSFGLEGWTGPPALMAVWDA